MNGLQPSFRVSGTQADFYSVALPYFEELKQDAYGLTKPSVFALYDLITRPAELTGLMLETGLAQLIIAEVGDESGALALIAYLMEALYLRAKARDANNLTQEDYNQLGSPQGNPIYSRVLELYFADQTTLQKALLSPSGQEAGKELARFENGLIDIVYGEVYEE